MTLSIAPKDLTKDSEFLQTSRVLKDKQHIKRDDGKDKIQLKKKKKMGKEEGFRKDVRICNSKFG